ncbi:MAG: Hpt domain-containing protein, partial [Candidatus Methylacidiphilales bacterium]
MTFTIDDIREVFVQDMERFLLETTVFLQTARHVPPTAERLSHALLQAHSMKGVCAMVSAWGLCWWAQDMEHLLECRMKELTSAGAGIPAEPGADAESRPPASVAPGAPVLTLEEVQEKALVIYTAMHGQIPAWQCMLQISLEGKLSEAEALYGAMRGELTTKCPRAGAELQA